jgi:hypothetical protein
MPYILTVKNQQKQRSITLTCEDERLVREFRAWAESEFGDDFTCDVTEITDEAFAQLPKIMVVDPPQ